MLSLGEEEDVRRYSLLAWLQALLLAAILTGASWILGGARTWVLLPIYGGIAGLIFAQIIRVILTQDSTLFRFDLADFWVVLFLGYAYVRYLTSPVEYCARLEWLTILACATVFWVVRYSLTHSSQGIFILTILALNGLGLASFAVWLHLHPEVQPFGQHLAQYYAPRLIGPFGCPNHLGDFLLMASAAAIGLAFFLNDRWVSRIFLVYALFVMVGVIGFTLSRGSWLGLLAGGLVLTIFCMRHSSLRWFVPLGLYLMGLMGAALALLRVESFRERLGEIMGHLQAHTLDHYVRMQLARDSLKIWHDHFWWGSGLATFNFEHPRYQGSDFYTHAYYAHNDYLNTLADYGLVGGLLIFGFIVTVTVLLFRKIDHRARSSRRIFLCAALVGWVAVAVHCAFDFNLHIPACALTLFALTGLGSRRTSMPGLHLPDGQTQVMHLIFAALLTLVLWNFGTLTLQTANGFYPYWQAVDGSTDLEPNKGNSVLPPDHGIPLLTRSILADPKNPWSLDLLGNLYFQKSGTAATLEERAVFLLAALRTYQRAESVNPLDDDLLYKVGLTYDALDRHSEALWCYQIVTQRQPYNGNYQQALGYNLRQQGNLTGALAAYQAALHCPYGFQGAQEAWQHIKDEMPQPNDPFHHSPTVP